MTGGRKRQDELAGYFTPHTFFHTRALRFLRYIITLSRLPFRPLFLVRAAQEAVVDGAAQSVDLGQVEAGGADVPPGAGGARLPGTQPYRPALEGRRIRGTIGRMFSL